VESSRYDIKAKTEGEFTAAERGPMQMALLQDRFQLAVHHETKEEQGIAVTKGNDRPTSSPQAMANGFWAAWASTGR
jgi:uncharacterized protein (TIGR03435 family)